MSSTKHRNGAWIALLPILALTAAPACRAGDPGDAADDAPAGAPGAPSAGTPAPATTASALDTIVTVGHGAFVGPSGRVLAPSRALFERTQRGYIDRLRRDADAIDARKAAAARTLITAEVSDGLVADAVYLDWLLDTVQPGDAPTLRSVNAAMRRYYLAKLAPSALPRDERERTRGVGDVIAQRLASGGVITNISTRNGGEKYVQECAAAGVPIPPPSFSDAWDRRGILIDEFLSPNEQAEVMMFTSDKPAGVCIGLPRFIGGGDDIDVFGVICLGTLTSKACFWDNPNAVTFQRDVQHPITDFVGGFDLDANAQGVCSDCHAGENPFVVHPERAPFVGFSAFGSHWYEPIVHPSWPQNPGPTSLLAGVSSPDRCDRCHSAGRSGGRFPAISTELAGYCSVVLGTAALNNAPNGTMPPYGADRNQFTSHINALRNACRAPPSTGKVVSTDVQDNPAFLSPPMVIDPIYACASKVAVRSGVLNAKLTVFVNGAAVGSRTVHDPDKEDFNVPALMIGDVVTAQQKLGGALSAMSAPVTARDHKLDYPSGLPKPVIDPTLVYECADLIAVRGVPGATITVFSNGGLPTGGSTSTDWTMFRPGKNPFVVGDEFTAEQSLCADTSLRSDKVNAVTAPSSLAAPTFDPPQTFPGQQLVNVGSLTNGSHTTLDVSGSSAGGFSTPISWWPNYDLKTPLGRALVSGDTIAAQQKLCVAGPTTKTPPTGKCEDLPAPRIFTPIAGTNFVTVWQAIPGARIHVFDASNTEIGDGSGSVIVLSRNLVIGDVLTVIQQVGECTSKTGYRIAVRSGQG